MGSKKPNRQKVLVALLSAILALGGDPLATRAWAEELAPEPAPVVAEAESLPEAGEVLVEEQAADTQDPVAPTPAEDAEEALEPEAPAESQEPEGNPEQSQAPPTVSAETTSEAPAATLSQDIRAAEAPIITTYAEPEASEADTNALAMFATSSPLKAAAADTMVVYYDFVELRPTTNTTARPAVGTNLLFAPTNITTVSSSEAFLGLPSGCGMMQVDGYNSNSNVPSGTTLAAHVKHPNSTQQSINTSVGFDGCNGAYALSLIHI